jgi:Carboxypeptidase regulatory-like domain
MSTNRHHTALCALFLLLLSGALFAQMTVTGSIVGTVTDPSGQVVPGAKVTLTSQSTGDIRNATTNDVGAFNFVAVPPATYSLKVEHGGFKAFQRTGVVVSANEHVAAGDIQLQIGAVTDTITVEAKSAMVQTDSAEHSAAITPVQLDTLTARGRDVVSMLRTIPGVQYQADNDSVGNSFGTSTPNIGGASNSMNIIAVDGVISNDMGTPATFSSVTTLDAIGEVKVILNSYQAEYAGNGGAIVEVVTKSGGREYHGTGYWFLKNEALNANDFFNNRSVSTTFPNGVPRPEYRYNALGASIGGPIYIPGKFNRNKNLLFGFYNLENWGIKVPGALTQYTMPSALERAGDFSQTLDTSGKVIVIKDPNTGVAFPLNAIPKGRLNANGVALLNTLPLPNFTNRAITGGNYNYQIQEVLNNPKRSQLFKIDVVPTDRDRFFVRGKTWLAENNGFAVAAPAKPTGFFAQCYCFTESGLSVGWTHVFSPTIVMEVTSGIRHNHEAWHPINGLDKVLRSSIGFTAGQFFPQANPQGFIPRFSFGGVVNPPDVSFDDRFLTGGTDFTFSFNDNVTISRGPHTFKVGVDAYRMREYEGERSIFSGTFSFAKDTNNPFDTNYAFSNAALGVFNSYTESNARYGANERESIVEWFVQDTWKVNRKLTLDYGLRFSWYNQMYPNNPGQQSVLALDRYSASQAPVLFQPVLSPTKVRMALNPVTGQLFPAVYIGAFVPGSGNPAPGGVLSGDNSYPRGFVDQQPVLYGPRLGFAYDPFGKGKTAIRAGASILYNMRLTKWSQTTENPPAIFSPITYYGNLDTFLQAGNVLSPSNTNAYNRQNKTPTNYNVSFGVQQDIGFSTLLDVSYLGVFGRHLQQTEALNTVPYGARFLAQNQDPTSAGKPLVDNFFRPLPGYNNVTFSDNAFSSNYHALLMALNRRFTRGLQLGVSYTYAKYMSYTGIPIYRPIRTWSYGPDASDQTHNLVVNFNYEPPKLSGLLPNPVVRWVFDGWMLSGIGQWVSGTPNGIALTTTDGTDLTGGGDGQRVNMVGNSASGDSTFYQWFNTAAFGRPGRGDPGNAARVNIRNPGVNNIDLALSKRFPLHSEKRFLQFRWEAYNAFNHTQYSTLNTTARFDPTGLQTNSLFGQVTATRAPRVMQGSLRLVF